MFRSKKQMNPKQFYIAAALGAVCLVLSILLISLARTDQHLQMELQNQQNEINRGSAAQQAGTEVLREMGQVAVTDSKMKEVLAKNGYTVTVSPPASATPAVSGTPQMRP